jgi:hypothetical protein
MSRAPWEASYLSRRSRPFRGVTPLAGHDGLIQKYEFLIMKGFFLPSFDLQYSLFDIQHRLFQSVCLKRS